MNNNLEQQNYNGNEFNSLNKVDTKSGNNTNEKLLFNLKKAINSKMLITAVSLIIQLLFSLLFYFKLKGFYEVYRVALPFMLICIYLYLVNLKKNAAYKISWITAFAVLPIFGLMQFILQHGDLISHKLKVQMKLCQDLDRKNANKNSQVLAELEKRDKKAFLLCNYIEKQSAYPPVIANNVEYFALGEYKFEALKQKMKQAKKFIFLEYFIVRKGKLFGELLEIMVQKVKEGVDVRIIYDEFGALFDNGDKFTQELESLGIKVKVFNPINKFFSMSLNNRNHRKIAVIDGEFAFMGGINIGDEYINVDCPHGHWKDTAVMISGNGAMTLTSMFLSMWCSLDGDNNFEDFYKLVQYKDESEFWKDLPQDKRSPLAQPFFDSSSDDEPLAENIYIKIIANAKKYIKITTPYLIPTDEMLRALKLASDSGVEVTIITPYIQDKKYIKMVNQSYYATLMDSGVMIYEYLPGFIHSKMIVCDDKYAVIGSVNLDYRSFYLNMESGCLLYDCDEILEMNADIDEIISKSLSITHKSLSQNPVFKLVQSFLRTFAPLL